MDMEARQLEDQERFAAFRALMRANVEQTMADYMERAKPVTSAEVRSHFQTIAVADRTLRQLSDLPPRPRARVAAEPKPDISRTPKAQPKQPASPPNGDMLRELEVISRLLDKTADTSDIEDVPGSFPPCVEPNQDAREVARDVAPEGAAPAAPPAQPPEEKPEPETESQPELQTQATPQQQLDSVLAKANDKLDKITYRCAEWAQIWPDGTLFEDTGADWRAHVGSQLLAVDLDGEAADHSRLLTAEALRRCNAIARQAASVDRVWFDNSPYRDSDPDFWSLSANLGTGVKRPADFEMPSPSCLPWWIIKERPT